MAFWVEPATCNTPATRVWVLVQPLLPAATVTLRVFFGQPRWVALTANAVNDPAAVFPQMQTFSGFDYRHWLLSMDPSVAYKGNASVGTLDLAGNGFPLSSVAG